MLAIPDIMISMSLTKPVLTPSKSIFFEVKYI